ncbi:MAG TPA: hypothetical protein VJJ20_03185 [Candidatus Paceibacterota bacterium]
MSKALVGIYPNSGLVAKAREERLLSFMDVDGTTASYSDNPSDQEIEARREIREILETHGGYVLTTARTPELCMSERVLRASRQAGFSRLDPKCYIENGVREYRPLSMIRKYAHLTDPDAIHSIGVGIWIKHEDAFCLDMEFYARYQVERQKWKSGVRSLIDMVDEDRLIRDGFSELEDPDNHKNGVVDVQELECRFEITAKPGIDGLAWKKLVRERLQGLRGTAHPLARIARSIEFIDESNPARGRYQLYLVPHKRLTKEGAFNHILRQVSQASGIPTSEFITFSSGDRMPDLKAGLFGGNRGYFVLPGGSILTEYLVGGKKGQDFAGQSLKSIVRRLKPLDKKGWYLFKMLGMTHPRVVVIADEAVRGDKTDAESILAVLKEINGDLQTAPA